MKRHLLKLGLIFLIVTICSGISVQANINGYENGFTYVIADQKATVLSCRSTDEKIVIPDTLGGYPVTAIENDAFHRAQRTLAEVVLPDSIETIGDYAFSGCNRLTGIQLSANLKHIGEGAFNDCLALTELTLPDGLEVIESDAFNGCVSLQDISFPKHLKKIGVPSLEDTLWYYERPEGLLYIGNILYQYKGNMPDNTSVTVLEGTEHIAKNAFWDCQSLTAITLPSSLKTIESGAFENCSGLSQITIPDSVTYLGGNAFSYAGLTDVSIGKGITMLEDGTFGNCKALREVTVPDGIVEIKDAFFGSENLETIRISDQSRLSRLSAYAFFDTKWYANLPNGPLYLNEIYFGHKGDMPAEYTIAPGTKSIAAHAFRNAANLTAVSIPSSVADIGEAAFYQCTALTKVAVPEGITQIKPETFYYCSSLSEVSLPDTLTAIKENAFFQCSALQTVQIPENVIELGAASFYGCSMLQSISLPQGVTQIENETFSRCSALESVELSPETEFIGRSAFSHTAIEHIDLPDRIEYLPECVFLNCTQLKTITMANRITEIDSSALSSCTALTDIYFLGNETQFGFIQMPEEERTFLDRITVHYMEDMAKYSLFFDANGGYGAPDYIRAKTGSTVVIPNITPIRDGYIFLGWAFTDDDDTADLQNNDTYRIPMRDRRLYAVWGTLNVAAVKEADQYRITTDGTVTDCCVMLAFYQNGVLTDLKMTGYCDNDMLYQPKTSFDDVKLFVFSSDSNPCPLRGATCTVE